MAASQRRPMFFCPIPVPVGRPELRFDLLPPFGSSLLWRQPMEINDCPLVRRDQLRGPVLGYKTEMFAADPLDERDRRIYVLFGVMNAVGAECSRQRICRGWDGTLAYR